MKIDLNPPDGGLLIEGTFDEFVEFQFTLSEAMDEGEAEGNILTNEAVETITIRVQPSEE